MRHNVVDNIFKELVRVYSGLYRSELFALFSPHKTNKSVSNIMMNNSGLIQALCIYRPVINFNIKGAYLFKGTKHDRGPFHLEWIKVIYFSIEILCLASVGIITSGPFQNNIK